MNSNLDAFLKRLDKAGSGLITATRTGVNEAARVMAAAIDASIAEDTHGTGVLHGTLNYKHTKPGVIHAKVNRANSTDRPVALVNTTLQAQMSWLERGTHGHAIGTGGKKGQIGIGHNRFGVIHSFNRKGETNYQFSRVKTPWGWRNGPWYVSGSPAKRTFTRAANATTPRVVEVMHRETNRALRDAFH